MSLQVWLPLLNDAHNQGLMDVEPTVMGTGITYTAGKLGNSATFPCSAASCIHMPGLQQQGSFSWACWFKCTGNGVSTYNQYILSEGRGYGTSGVNIYLNNAGNTLSARDGASVISKSITLDEWHHVVLVFDGTNKTCYIDGEQVGKATAYSEHDYTQSNDRFVVGKMAYSYTLTSNYFPFNGQICDVRIYDHALSVKEVKELSKGLIAHYPLNDYHSFGPINKYSSPYSDGELSACSWTKTKLPNERGWNYKLTRTGDRTNYWANGAVPNFTFTAGKTYCYSLKIRCNKWTAGGLDFRAARANNDWVTIVKNVCSQSKADGKWHEYYICQTVPETFDRSGTTMTSNPRIELYTGNLVTEGTVYDMDFDIKDIQVVESDSYVPFISNDVTDTTIYDCSGYCRNGVASGTISAESDPPRYAINYQFLNASVNCPSIHMSNTFTISTWIKTGARNDWGRYFQLYVSDADKIGLNDHSMDHYIGFHISRSIDGTKKLLTDKYLSDYSFNTWYHITVVLNGKSLSFYRDGELKYTVTLPNDFTDIAMPLYINSLNGSSSKGADHSLSDFRIYATALSAEEIKELYETSVSIDQNGNTWAYELEEV